MRHKTNLIKLHTLKVLDLTQLTWFVIFSAKQGSRYFILTCMKLPVRVVFNTFLFFLLQSKEAIN